MKKLFLLILVPFGSMTAFSQSESEPNNSFTTANNVLEGVSTTATVGGADASDHFKATTYDNANVRLIIEATNTSPSGAHTLQYGFYNGLTMPGPILNPQLQHSQNVMNRPISAGETVYDTIIVCGFEPDNYYMRFIGTGTFNYVFKWDLVNVATYDGENNTRATARPFSFNILRNGSLAYEYWGNMTFDTVNYFKSVLPAGDYSTKRLYLTAQYNGCFGNAWVKYSVFRNDEAAPFATGFLGNDSTLTSYQQVNQSFLLNNMVAGDSLFVKWSANGPVAYSMIYREPGGFTDFEDNCCTHNAYSLAEDELVGGNVGTYDWNDEVYLDEFDTYRITMPHYGGITLQLTALNTECNEEYYGLDVDVLDEMGNEVQYVSGIMWDGYPACNEQQTKSITINGLLDRTYYLRLKTGWPGRINYNFRYNVTDSTTRFDVESNGSTATAIPLAPGEVKQGNVRFLSSVTPDVNDYYRVDVPADGKLSFNLTSRYLGSEEFGNNTFYKLQVEVIGRFTSVYSPGATPPVLVPRTTYTENPVVCAVGAGTYYLRVTSGNFTPQEYELSYQFTDTSSLIDAEPNNTKPTAQVMPGGETRNGSIYYYYNANVDVEDYHKMVFSTTDSLVLFVSATNTSCVSGRRIRFSAVNKNNISLFNRYIANNTSIADGQTVYDTVRMRIIGPDTIYIRFFDDVNTGAFRYTLTTKALPPYSIFNLHGDTTVCISTQTYTASGVAESTVNYNWSLPDGGGTLTFVDSVATVNWTSPGNRRVQLFLSNAQGTSAIKNLNVIINGIMPTQTPVAYNFARMLSTNSLPPGAHCQWYKNGIAITGATDSTYYAADAGSFTVRFTNDCGTGPESNAIEFAAAALSQTITFPAIPDVQMSPNLKLPMMATASSGLPVYYQRLSGPAIVVNDTLKVTGAGTIIVRASQPGDDDYSAATTVNDTIVISKGNQVISFDSIPDQIFNTEKITLVASSSAGLSISYSIVAGTAFATVSGNKITKRGVGTVTVRASQNGNASYNAALPVERTFCMGVRELSAISGDPNPCINTYRYLAQRIPGANYIWTLTGGGILTTNLDTAWVQWQNPGSYVISVKANSPCDPTFSDPVSLDINTSSNAPAAVTGMLPFDHAQDEQLPLKLSWIPGLNTVNYDLYVWDSAQAQPATPFVSNISGFTYTIPRNALVHNTVYKWRVVSKNPCQFTSGPIQHFRIIPLPDLVVSNVQAPSAVSSGQTVTISWTVTNAGPGNTLQGSNWSDGVYFSFDTFPNFHGSIDWNASSWNSVTSNGRPLLLGKRERPTGLAAGQSYTNSLDFTLPLSYSFPVYIYVITNNQNPNYPIAQVTVANDTARKQDPMMISLAPTPDLRVDSVFTPAITFSGSTINVAYKVKNYGVLTPLGQPIVDSFFISQNPLFDRSQSIPLFLPKANDSYYPNAVPAYVRDTTQLLPDQTVTRNADVVIPNFIMGTWFIYVKTNANTVTNGFIYEGPLSTNNVGQAQLEVYLTPTPKLVVNSLQLPVSTASTTQPIGVNYNIRNEGFTDNIERNKGHYLVRMIDRCPCHAPAGCNCVCVGSPVYKDSVVLGSSHWLERIYLSTDPAGLNPANAQLVKEVRHDSAFAGMYYPDEYTKSYQCNNGGQGAINVKHALKPGANFPMNVGFTVPETLPPGNYYVYVYTNPTRTVFEYPGTPQIRRSDLPISIQRPDLTVPVVTVPATATGAQPVTVNYEILNTGQGSVFNHLRTDRLFVSNFPVFDASAQVVNVRTYTADLPAGTNVPYSFNYTFPAATTGNKYFFVQVNYDSAFRETNYVNNLSASAMTFVSAAVPADLVIAEVLPQDTMFTIFDSYIRYTVTNSGTGTTAGTWKDSLFISCNPVFNSATSFFIAERQHTKSIAPGESYSDTALVQMKMAYELLPCFPQQMHSTAYFFVKTNANNGIYEAGNVGNNSGGSSAAPLVNPLVDHFVTSVTAPDTATVGHPYPTTWKTRNLGYKPIYIFSQYTYYYKYHDAIYLSADSILDPADVMVGSYLKYVLLNRGEEKQDMKAPSIPNVPTGDYYLLVKSNNINSILAEKVVSNNTNTVRNLDGTARKIHVVKPLLPDLVDSILSVPPEVAAGQPVTIKYRVTNKGTGPTYPETWKNNIRLSVDFLANPNDGDRVLATRTRTGELAPGASFDDSLTVNIPVNTVPGNYVIIGVADSDKNMVEEKEENNLGFGLITISAPLIADLVVQEVSRPDTVYLGYTVDSVKWVVGNLSSNPIKGTVRDGIYLTHEKAWDSAAVLLGTVPHKVDLEPVESDTSRLAPIAHSVVEGEYYVMVVTDVLANVDDENRANNYAFTETPVYVKVKELPLHTDELNTLQHSDRYYKLIIPDTLLGATIRVTLKTGDSLSVRNEMFIAGGYIPSPAQHDFAFEIPNSGNQRIIMADIADSIYYIRIRSVSPNPPVQSITLRADVLPFSILDVNSASGANIGNVTVKMSGSLFVPGMTAKLTRGATVKTASAVYYTNSTTVFATFNLQGAPLGLYNVTLIKPDTTETTLVNGFSVVLPNNGGLITGSGPNTGAGNGNAPGCYPGAPSGLNSQLAVQLVVPPSVILGRPMIIQIHFSNPTNFDIPVQTRTLYSEDDMKMALTKEGVPSGTTSLVLELTEPGGPPGIIRPGGSGTILVYTKAPTRMPADPIGWFTLQ